MKKKDNEIGMVCQKIEKKERKKERKIERKKERKVSVVETKKRSNYDAKEGLQMK